jgi:hypothetical protein
MADEPVAITSIEEPYDATFNGCLNHTDKIYDSWAISLSATTLSISDFNRKQLRLFRYAAAP